MIVQVETRRPGDEEQRLALGREVFGNRSYDPPPPLHPAAADLCVYDGAELVAGAACISMGQYFGGVRVAMGGLASVAVRPDRRGSGVAKRLVRASLEAMAERGEVISMLYPTTAQLYRHLGYEIAGGHGESAIPIDRLPSATKMSQPEIVDPGDVALERRLYTEVAPHGHGWIDRSDSLWERTTWFVAHQQTARVYAGRRDGRIVWTVRYSQTTPSGSDRWYDIEVDDLVALDRSALVDALAFLGANGTVAGRIVTTAAPMAIAQALDHAPALNPVSWHPWMLRIVDVAGAMQARRPLGYETARVELSVHDDVLVANSRRWVVELADGIVTVEPGGSGTVELTVGTLASLYTGWLDPRRAAIDDQLIGAGPGDLEALRRLFTAPAPWCPDFF